MKRWFSLMLVIVTVSMVFPITPAAGQDSDLIDDFETGSFADRWWFYTDNRSFACSFDSPGYASQRALQLAYEAGPDQWPGCGMSIDDPGQWTGARGLSLVWRSDPPDQPITITISLHDPTQTNPDAGGFTPFISYQFVPGAWTETTLRWDQFQKAVWIGPDGTDTLDPSQIAELLIVVSSDQPGTIWIDDFRLIRDDAPPVPTFTAATFDKYALWTNGTQLRGINIWQHVIVPDVDGLQYLGSGHVGPPHTRQDFAQIAELGANLVIISGPGLYTETPPYVLDEKVQANLDAILALITEADLFAVISVRTGPGRNDFTFYGGGFEDSGLVIEHVWTDQTAQDAWVDMWRYTAERYRYHPNVIGYELMVEPNAAGQLLGIWEGSDFYPAYEGTLYDWNQFYPRLVEGIRSVDEDTPILVSPMSWGAVRWLPYLRVFDDPRYSDPRMVYTIHQYEPQDQYTHQEPGGTHTYPGSFDLTWDGQPDAFNRAWLDGYLSVIDDFQAMYGVPVAVTEYGLGRYVPNAADFMRDEMALFEARGLNHAFWAWNSIWPPRNVQNDGFDILHGPDPDNHTTVDNDLLDVVLANWRQNTVRPSNVGE
ncbi:MAG: cellulase family glycosylhydrolase [Anaerolineae bacterium]|nr:cellulase family glycosylhydrolase [Anaerolineae bacterium]